MGDMGSMCCCAIVATGFDFYGYVPNGNFSAEILANTIINVTGQSADADGNWFPEWLTRANVLKAQSVDRLATNQAYSTTFTPPLTPGVVLPTTLDAGDDFTIGTLFRTGYNSNAGLICWVGYFDTRELDTGEYVPVDDTDRGYYIAIVQISTGTILLSRDSVSDDESLLFEILPDGNHRAFDGSHVYFNQNRWDHEWSPGGPDTDNMAYFTDEGSWGMGVLRWTIDAVGPRPFGGAYPASMYRRAGLRGWDAKTLENSTDFRTYKNWPAVPEYAAIPDVLNSLWGTDGGTYEYTAPSPSDAQAFYDHVGDNWAYVIAASDPTIGFGYNINADVTVTGSTNYTLELDDYARGIVFGTITDGQVAGYTAWTSDPFVSVIDDVDVFGVTTTHFYGVTGAGLQCDAFDGAKAGVIRTDANDFIVIDVSIIRDTIAEDAFLIDFDEGIYWPESSFQTYYAVDNGYGTVIANGFNCKDYGSRDQLLTQLNDEDEDGFTTQPEDAFTALCGDTAIVYSHANYQCGWEPVEAMVARDETGDIIVLEKFVGTKITPKTVSNPDSDSSVLGINDLDADEEMSLTLLSGGGFNTRLVLIASLDDAVDSIRVSNTADSSAGTYSSVSTGTQGRWKWEIISVDTATSTNRRIWASRPTAGIVAIAACHCGPWTGTPTATVGSTPTAITSGSAGSQIMLAVSPAGTATQDASIHLTGQGRLRQADSDSNDDDLACGIVTNTSETWSTDSNQAWTVGDEVTDTLGVTFMQAWGSGSAWTTISTDAPANCRVRRITQAGVTSWVRRIGVPNQQNQLAVADKAVYVATAQPTTPYAYWQRFTVIDALTGAARGKNYPNDPPGGGENTGWYGVAGVTDVFDRWACVPVFDELSTQNLAAWIDDNPMPIGNTL